MKLQQLNKQIKQFANNGGGTCGQDSSLQDPNNNNTNPKCESATSKRLGNPTAAYPKGSFGDMKSLFYYHQIAFRGERVDPLKVKQGERERFEKKQREEKARIDAHVKAVKEEAALKLLRRDKVTLASHLRRFSGLGPTLDYSFLDYSYSSARDFAVDVKLTFSNAMKFNPSTNWVHELAGEFSRMFTLEWKSLEAKLSEEVKSDLVYKDQGLMEISKRKLPPKLHGHLRRLGLLCENKDDGETASEIQIFTSSCFKSNVIGKFANNTSGTCGHDSSLKDLKNNNTNPKCESATSKRLGNPVAAYPKGSFDDTKSRRSHDNAFSEASSGLSLFSTTIK
ncbi:hypothetical protein Syun_028156 [Stephania yunnanensis]|uniref:Bromo domain-containing protein n=1 Tax=Stephania yunnanensis TaxID=152371 RepID=A0AAP0EJC6_9MAGN